MISYFSRAAYGSEHQGEVIVHGRSRRGVTAFGGVNALRGTVKICDLNDYFRAFARFGNGCGYGARAARYRDIVDGTLPDHVHFVEVNYFARRGEHLAARERGIGYHGIQRVYHEFHLSAHGVTRSETEAYFVYTYLLCVERIDGVGGDPVGVRGFEGIDEAYRSRFVTAPVALVEQYDGTEFFLGIRVIFGIERKRPERV